MKQLNPDTVKLEVHQVLPAQMVEAIDFLEAQGRDHDGVHALDEAAQLEVHRRMPTSTHLLLTAADELIGYANIMPDHTVQGLVAPKYRRQGFGRMLLEQALKLDSAGKVWCHGGLEAATRLCLSVGCRLVRTLLVMRVGVPAEYPAPTLDRELVLRPIDPAEDLEAFTALNQAAFAWHPEQGQLNETDMAERMGQSWFDPQRLLLAFHPSSETPVGFVWMKPAEVYAIGVLPQYQGRGWGRMLMQQALHDFSMRQVEWVDLYVDGENIGAVELYKSLGFNVREKHLQYGRTGI